ncbi:ketopantoate reductase family protein [Marininema halotolerans]|uniref:2-dehydropantoate 2-reductase n=1 Tax=Marininema halotolerans TaxID=1155944 RepID=A0A1I6QBP3_9BACL|nr:2-dehydropantoate 2-reductase [Marininema halotolerans]SFS49822.1 2-dehydropantoate 2-reductase [Marininema halotolerans]
METAIWGAGSIGLLWGARLALAGQDPLIITRTKEQQEHLLRNGLHLRHRSGRLDTVKVRVEWAGKDLGAFDRILLTVKQTAIPSLIPRIVEQCRQGAMLYLLQNGMGAERWMVDKISPSQLWRGSTTEGALREGDTIVVHTGEGETYFGPFTHHVNDQELRWINTLKEHGLPVEYDPFIHLRTWKKLAINCVINPLTALLQIKNGALVDQKDFTIWLERILAEVVCVAKSDRIVLDKEELKEKVRHVCEQTAQNRSSMAEDLRLGHPSEIDFINGFIVTMGREKGVKTPFNQELLERVHRAEGKYG